MTNKTIADQAVDTRLMVALLSKASIGQTVTYAEMSKQLSRQIEGSDSYLQSALRIAQRDHDKVFSVVRGEGYKCLSDGEIVALGGRLPLRIRRMARKTVKTVSKARDAHLTNEQIVQRNALVSMAGVLAHVSSDKIMRQLESEVQSEGSKELPIGRTLELFRGKAA